MRAFKSIGLFFAVILTCVLLMILCYLLGVKKGFQNGGDQGKVLVQRNAAADQEAEAEKEKETEEKRFASFLDVSSDSGLLRKNTEFVVVEKNLRDGTSGEETLELPSMYVGLDFTGFLEAVEKYNQAPPLSEREKGFSGMEVLRFSRDRVVVQKNYKRADPESGFYLALLDQMVIVLLEDRKTVYMTTDISIQMLPKELARELAGMIYVEDEAALFDFLEAYTS